MLVAGAVPGGLFNGTPTGISQRCPGAPCAGFRAAVDALLVAGVVVMVAGWPAPGAGGVGVNVVAGADGTGSAVERTPEFWQEAKRSAKSAMLKNLFITKELVGEWVESTGKA